MKMLKINTQGLFDILEYTHYKMFKSLESSWDLGRHQILMVAIVIVINNS